MSLPTWTATHVAESGGVPPAAQSNQREADRAHSGDPQPEQLVGAILVVDDDPEIRDVVRWLLEDEGWTVETASDGRDALERATQIRPALIVLDMGLPILSGEEVAMRLRVYYHEPPPIVVVSADGRAGEKAARIGAAAYLHKPFDVDELARLVRRTLTPP
jgi:DNA-binding response OmpR family regulator